MVEEGKKAGEEEAGEKASEAVEGEKPEDFEALAEEYSSELKYLAAEFDNYRKRAARERKEASQAAVEKMAAELLPVLDDFDATIKALKDNGADEKTTGGVSLVQRKFLGILEGRGLKRIATVGQRFDVDLHEAAGFEEGDADDGIIVREVQAGYKVGKTVVRHAKVVVAKKKEAKEKEQLKEKGNGNASA